MLQFGDKTVVDIELDASHIKNPLLDVFEIITKAVALILQDQECPSNREKRALGHLRNVTRFHKTQKE